MAKIDKKIFKQFTSEVKVDDAERTVTAVISTGAIDRDKEVLLPKGLDTENYMKNPVVMWAHDYSDMPIGKARYIDKKRKEIVAQVEFADSEKANEVYELFKGGFLKAFSVGFIIKKSHAPTPDEIKKTPEWAVVYRVIDEWELLEFSAVPVPANPEALATAVKSATLELSDETKTDLHLGEGWASTAGVESTSTLTTVGVTCWKYDEGKDKFEKTDEDEHWLLEKDDDEVVKLSKPKVSIEAVKVLSEPVQLKGCLRLKVSMQTIADEIKKRLAARKAGRMY